MWDPPIETILKEIQAYELARFAGLSLWHNCNHFWGADGDWDQAVVCCTRFEPWTEEAATVMRDADKQGLFARRPTEICSLYKAEAAEATAAAAAEEEEEDEEEDEEAAQ